MRTQWAPVTPEDSSRGNKRPELNEVRCRSAIKGGGPEIFKETSFGDDIGTTRPAPLGIPASATCDVPSSLSSATIADLHLLLIGSSSVSPNHGGHRRR
ncbi:unnamed protein product [Nezara viridula]|uniref:Uncharacterized protein n=1 Tax=Nezara viridula TaxID=85310 RepID=A0A9P0HDB6_NEZVI|nr:unnamed protein product [Nezara viridula]